MTPWNPDPRLPPDDRRLAKLRRLGSQRRTHLKGADDTLAEIEPLVRELYAAGEKKRVIAEYGGISRTHLDKILDGD